MIAVTLTLHLPGRRETLNLSLPDGVVDDEHVFTVRDACLLYPDEPLADGDGLIILPVMLGG